MSDIIDVTCVVLPDGRTIFFEDSSVDVAGVLRRWRESMLDPQRYDDTCGGCLIIRMLREDYDAISDAVAMADATLRELSKEPPE